MICFSRRFKLQLTADLFIPASSNISIVSQKTRYLQRCKGQLVPQVSTVFHDTLSHPNHRAGLILRNSCK